mgnify:CR=1 FL=1
MIDQNDETRYVEEHTGFRETDRPVMASLQELLDFVNKEKEDEDLDVLLPL